MVIDGDRLLVVNQNVNTHLSGEVLAFDKETGASLGAVVAESDKNAPYVPRGIVLGPEGDDLFVGNFSTAQGKSHGSLLRYDLDSGALLSNDKAKGFKNHDFHPRGVVFGPDGMLYVASPMDLKTGLGGAVLRFNADGIVRRRVVRSDAGGFGQLNRPEGLVFGPDGNLYVTSFRAAPGDKDGVRVYDPRPGTSSGRSIITIRRNDAAGLRPGDLVRPGRQALCPDAPNGRSAGLRRDERHIHDVHRCRHGLDQSVLHDVRPDQSQHAGL